MKQAQAKIKHIVSFFHHSVKATDKLGELQDQNGVQRKKLIMDVETRWNSTFYMMERFLEQHEAITTVLCMLGRAPMCLNSDELQVVKGTVSLLEPFEEATREISSEKFTSLSKVIPIAKALQEWTNVNSARNNDAQTTSLRNELKTQLQKRFPAMEQVFQRGAATLLDTRFKKVAFADPENVKEIEDKITEVIRSAYTSSQEASTPEPVPVLPSHESQSSGSHINEGQPKRKKESLWKSFHAKVEMTKKTSLATAGPHIEMKRYLEEPLIPLEEDPLKWWKMHSAFFPKLQTCAKMFLCIPATSVPAERIFSKGGELVSHRRNALSNENINMILFLNKNGV